MRTILLALAFATCLGCLPDRENSLDRQDKPAVSLKPYETQLLRIAEEYESYGRVNKEQMGWAPTLCAPVTFVERDAETKKPTQTRPLEPGMSLSPDTSTHGRKLYWMFARKRLFDDYANFRGFADMTNQAVVKETWIPVEMKDGETVQTITRTVMEREASTEDDAPVREVVASWRPVATGPDGRKYKTGQKGPLFVMFQADPSNGDTDEGWVYATLTPDGKKVLESGRIESCMKCHRDAPHGRLFGIRGSK